jgi:phosphoribosylanthranilate isomerase
MTRIKICGLKREADIEAVNLLKPDYIGFVFARSFRQISAEKAAALKKKLSPDIKAVGVFVNGDPACIEQLLLEGIIDMAQLHGNETEETVRRIREKTGKPVIKAVSVRTAADLKIWKNSSADFLLLDHGNGGSGEAFDWSILKDFDRPYFLAGGLNPDNIAAALIKVRPPGVDVSSGVETDGYKDRRKIAAFIKAVRKFDEEDSYVG